MHSTVFALGGLVALVAGSPAPSFISAPTRTTEFVSPITPGPSLGKRQVQLTTETMSNFACTSTQDPHLGLNGCTCDNGLYLDYTSAVIDGTTTEGCPQTVYTSTYTSTYVNPFPFTTTLPNKAVVAYEKSITLDPPTVDGYGSSTTVLAGSSLTLQYNPTDYVNAGMVAEESAQSSLYTTVSNALTAGCPSPTTGETITACTDVPAVTGVAYWGLYELQVNWDGALEISVEEVSYTNWDDFILLVNTIASGIAASAHNPNNSESITYMNVGDPDYIQGWTGEGYFTNIPSTLLAILTTQTEETNGQSTLQDLGIKMKSVEGSSAFGCSDVSLILSGIAAAAALAPGVGSLLAGEEEEITAIGVTAGVIGSLSFGAAGSLARFGLSAGCASQSWKRDEGGALLLDGEPVLGE